MNEAKPKFQGIIPAELVDAVRTARCILFVGAGLSAQVSRSDGSPLPSWSALLLEFLDWAISRQARFWGDPEDIRAMIQKGNLLMAAQELQDRLGTATLGEFLDRVFRDRTVLPSSAHRMLPRILFRAVLTTNYDSLIEGAYSIENGGSLPPVWTQEDLSFRPSPLRGSDFFLFKIHGHLDRPNSVVLGSRDYQDLLFRTPGYRQFLETLFATHTVLFVGFGGSDPNLEGVLDRLASIYSRTLDRHFILFPAERFNTTEKRRLALDRRLEVIEYDADASHSQVGAFLGELASQAERGPTAEAQSARKSNQLTVFISHAVADTDIVEAIATVLKEHDYAPWVADTELLPGDDIGQTISEGIAAADVFLVVLSSNSLRSKWVQREIESAVLREDEKRVVVVPILIGDVEPPAFLQNRFYLRLQPGFSTDALAPLLRSLKRISAERRSR
jgi:SIR2-like protein/TIR domain-containing protein